MIVYQKRNDHADHRLYKSKWHIEDDQTLQDAFYSRKDCLISGQDRVCRHEVIIYRINDKIVRYHTDQSH